MDLVGRSSPSNSYEGHSKPEEAVSRTVRLGLSLPSSKCSCGSLFHQAVLFSSPVADRVRRRRPVDPPRSLRGTAGRCGASAQLLRCASRAGREEEEEIFLLFSLSCPSRRRPRSRLSPLSPQTFRTRPSSPYSPRLYRDLSVSPYVSLAVVTARVYMCKYMHRSVRVCVRTVSPCGHLCSSICGAGLQASQCRRSV